MENNWFECKAKYIKIDQTGNEKNVTEAYLIDALSFTEAEERFHQELEKMISGEFEVTTISKSNITEFYPSEDADRWYKVKVSYVNVDEKSGKEKKVGVYMLAEASNVKDAFDKIEDNLKDWLVPFEIPAIQESPIIDVFPYFTDEVNEKIPENLTPVSETATKRRR